MNNKSRPAFNLNGLGTLLALLTGFLLALPAGAATVQIDYDDSIDWSAFETFAWKEVGPDHPIAPNPLMDGQIRKAIAGVLENKGFGPAEKDADFELIYHVNVHDEFRVTDWGYGRRWGRRLEVDTYREGTLVLDVIDAKSGKLVWRGAISELVPGRSRRKSALPRAPTNCSRASLRANEGSDHRRRRRHRPCYG